MGAGKKQSEMVLVSLSDVPDLKANPTPVIADSVIDPLTFMGRDGQVYRLSGLDSPALSDPDAAPSFVETSTKCPLRLDSWEEPFALRNTGQGYRTSKSFLGIALYMSCGRTTKAGYKVRYWPMGSHACAQRNLIHN